MAVSTPPSQPPVTDRPLLAGPDDPAAAPPFPLRLKGVVCKGFGRGSKELGIPTANLPSDVAEEAGKVLQTGIYYGYASVGADMAVYPMVMSFGWNPYYKNTKRSAEVHIIHTFPEDFYGEELRVIICGYIRDEKDYDSLDALITDIKIDIYVAQNSLSRPKYVALAADSFLRHVSTINGSV